MQKWPVSSEELLQRMLPASNPDPSDRARAWEEWQRGAGGESLQRYIRHRNYSFEPNDDIYQETLSTAFAEVERGRYQPRPGVPFAAYTKGIARNKIREASRRGRRWVCVALDDVSYTLADAPGRQPEIAFDQAQRRAHLYDGLAMLPPGRRQVLERIIRGEQTAEIAEAMQISEDLVRQHKSRGLRKLREIAFLQEIRINPG
jgi:RNA polymerase sigma factor (sigma-70 family)